MRKRGRASNTWLAQRWLRVRQQWQRRVVRPVWTWCWTWLELNVLSTEMRKAVRRADEAQQRSIKLESEMRILMTRLRNLEAARGGLAATSHDADRELRRSQPGKY